MILTQGEKALLDEATERVRARKGAVEAFRSCWNCNGAHEHLKTADFVFVCFACGHYFFKGLDLTEAAKEGA